MRSDSFDLRRQIRHCEARCAIPAGGDAPGVEVEVRDESADTWEIKGRAVVYDAWTTLYENQWFTVRELIRRGAAAESLADGTSDVRLLWNHDTRYVLGRNKSGTLELTDGPKGLDYSARKVWGPQVRELVIEPIRLRDVTGSSFAFTLRERDGKKAEVLKTEEFEDGREVWSREVLSIDVWDVSPVAYPAYEDTSVVVKRVEAARSARAAKLAEAERRGREAAARAAAEAFRFNLALCGGR